MIKDSNSADIFSLSIQTYKNMKDILPALLIQSI